MGSRLGETEVWARRAKLRRRHCALRIQAWSRERVQRWWKRRAFAEKLCGEGSVYEVMRMRAVVASWREFAEEQARLWREGMAFGAFRAAYLWVEGNRERLERRVVVFADRLEVVNPDTGKVTTEFRFGNIKEVLAGENHHKHDVTIVLKSFVREEYTVTNVFGFMAAFKANFLRWHRREMRKKKEKRLKKHGPSVFKQNGPEAPEDFRPKPEVELPSLRDSRAAVGDTSSLVKPLRMALDSDGDKHGLFARMQSPWKDEWASVRRSKMWHQSYESWVSDADKIVPCGSNRNTIYLVALGDLDEWNGGIELSRIANFCESYFHGLRVARLPPIPLHGVYKDRGMRLDIRLTGFSSKTAVSKKSKSNRLDKFSTSKQLPLQELEKYLRKLLPFDAFMLVGVTLHQVNAGSGYTSGNPWMTLPEQLQKACDSRTAVLSLARLDPWFRKHEAHVYINPTKAERKDTLLRRTCLWIAHHMMLFMNMEHCAFHSCCMNGFTHLEEMEHLSLQVCPVCLRKLLDALGIKTTKRCVERYQAMRRFCHVNKRVFAREFMWYGRRALSLEECHVETLTQFQLDKLFPKSAASKKNKSLALIKPSS